ncbi:universal stress protein [Parapedobacter koreensis]|uniref:Nucleotide-binding universal stress protein, UspA family n=1 Tax=Parapedobacter koreensis TaxID=332977 RepID=A0A1H7TRC9_9SPHI|nr:universal stress protein [Parapedobacter koreensis]SEL87125.1 Nucleotide-binding universal stress protein, UspA family [Parapedobacter koreensis]
MRTIIVATDFSKEAENAVDYAAALVQQIGGKIVLFNLYVPSIHVSNARLSPQAFDESATRTKERLATRAAALGDTYSIPVSSHLSVMGDMGEEIEHLFTVYDASLLVMGMAAKSLEQDLLGNTTTALIHQFKFPVLAIPYGAKFHGIDRILFACDNLQGINRVVLDEVKALALGAKASVEIFHVNNQIQKIQEQGIDDQTINTFGEGLEGVTYYYKDVESNAVIKAIQDELIDINADILIMLPNKYGFWGSLIHRSKTRIMASGLSVVLLSIPLTLASKKEKPGA